MDLVDLAKAWKGEPGDKRNTKYAAVGGGSAALSSIAINRIPNVREMRNASMRRGLKSVEEFTNSPAFGAAPGDPNYKSPREVWDMWRKAMYKDPGMKSVRASRRGIGVLAAGGGMSAYAAYRKNKE